MIRDFPWELPPPNLKGCAAVLAHELGHVFGREDEPDGGDNVRAVENPVRIDLGLPTRTSKEGWPIFF